MKKKYRKSLMILLLFTVYLVSCATFSGTVPIDADGPEVTYISPLNADGKKDRLVVPVTLPEIKGLNISGYRFLVTDTAGSVVFLDENSSESPKGFAGLFKKPSVEIPAEFSWDGRDTRGSWAADGSYAWSVEAWDPKGNRGSTLPAEVIVDNTPPAGSLQVPFLFFSPNGDGRQDSLPISHNRFSQEDTWKAGYVRCLGKNRENLHVEGKSRRLFLGRHGPRGRHAPRRGVPL